MAELPKVEKPIINALSNNSEDIGAEHMHRAEKRVMLFNLGVSWTEQPTRAADMDRMLCLAKAEDAAKYNALFDSLIRNTGAPAFSKEDMDKLNLSKLLVEQMEKAEAEYQKALETIRSDDRKKLEESYEQQISDLKDEFNRRIEKLVERVQKTADEEVAKAAENYKLVKHEIHFTDDEPVEIDGVLPECFDHLMQLAKARKNIMMVGPSGAGKTHNAAVIAKALELDFATQSCSAGMSESALSGWLIPIEEGGTFTYAPSEFVKIYENGGVFLFDEIDAADPNVLIFMNQALANDGFHLPQRYENPKVKKHKDFVAVAAANTYGIGADAMYTARNQLDAATLDRFRVGIVDVDYSAAVEEKLVDENVLAWGREVRKVIADKSLRRVMSTRLMIDATDMKRKCGWSLEQIESSYFSDWSPEERKIVQDNMGMIDHSW